MSGATSTVRMFDEAVASMRAAKCRNEIAVREIPSPERVAPYSFALGAGVQRGTVPADEAALLGSPFGAGRLVLLCDPEQAASWGSPLRVVCFAQAPLETEIGEDPFIAEVAWSWLEDALHMRHANFTFLSGTATKSLSSSFGAISDRGESSHIELRASWTPLDSSLGAHVEAWSELLCLLAGFPHQEGVVSLAVHKRMQAHGARHGGFAGRD